MKSDCLCGRRRAERVCVSECVSVCVCVCVSEDEREREKERERERERERVCVCVVTKMLMMRANQFNAGCVTRDQPPVVRRHHNR